MREPLMREHSSPQVREAIQAESKAAIANRVSVVFILSAVFLLLAVPLDRDLGTTTWHQLLVVRVGGAALQVALALWLRASRDRSWERVVALSLACFAAGFFTTLAVALLTSDPLLLVFVLVLVQMMTYVVLPWGVGPNVVLGVLALGCLLAVVDQLSANVTIAVLAAMVISVYAAAVFDRQRVRSKASELLRAGHERVLEMIAGDRDPCDVLAELLRVIEEQDPELKVAVLLRDESVMRVAAALGLPERYVNALDGMPIDERDAFGAVLVRGEPVVVDALPSDPRTARVHRPARDDGLLSCWFVLLRGAEGQVLGAFAVHRGVLGHPAAGQVELVSALARIAVIALERRAARQQLARYIADLDGARARAVEQASQLAEARDEAFASARAKSEFLANMSHEIRTPLNGVIGITELLLDSPLAPSDREHVATVRRCGEHLLGVINDILDFSRIEAGKMPIESLGFDLRSVVEEAAELLAPQAHEKGFELVCDVPPDLVCNVTGDAARVRQVLINLLANAIKFTERGEVAIEARLLRESAASVLVRIAVRDTGIGIPSERQAAIFESFTQADGSTTRRHGGTGLGLTICQQLVNLMGGHIGLESVEGQGSTFWIELALPKAVGRTRGTAGTEHLRGLDVLIVDDNETNRLILRRTLAAWGCNTLEAASGPAALELLAERTACGRAVGLAILDMQMPEMDGQETARRIHADPHTASLPLILLSSVGALADARQMGFSAALAKPVRQATLLCAVLAALGRPVGRPGAEPAAPRAFRPLSERLRVLLAEDNRVNRMVALHMLQRFGCDVDSATTGREAVEAVAANEYDLVLMDVQMPEMDGFEATAEIRRREAPGHRLPIIAMTAHAMTGDQERCLAAGMDDYVAKPVTRETLVAKLEHWIVERRGRAAAAREAGPSASGAAAGPSARDGLT